MHRRPIPHRQGLLREGWGPALAHLSVAAAEPCCWCTAPAALWTGEGLGWGWLGDCSLLPPSFVALSVYASQSQTSVWPFSVVSAVGWLEERFVSLRKFWNMTLLTAEFDCPEVTLCSWQDVKIQSLANHRSQSEVFACPSSCRFCWSS